MAWFDTDLDPGAATYRSFVVTNRARNAGARLADIEGLRRLVWRFFRRRRLAVGLCVECGCTLDGHRCPPTEVET